MTRLRRIYASIESIVNSIKNSNLGNPIICYVDNNGDGFYISYLKLNKPKSPKDTYDRKLYLFASNDVHNPIAEEEITDIKNSTSLCKHLEQVAIDKITKGKINPVNFERRIIYKPKDIVIPNENDNWDKIIDKILSDEADKNDENLIKDSYAITEFIFDKKDGNSIGLFISYDPKTHYMCLLRNNDFLVTKELVQEGEEQVIYDKLAKNVVSAGKDLAKDNNLQSLRSQDYYAPSKLNLSIETGSTDWINFCSEFGEKQQEKSKKQYKTQKTDTLNIDKSQLKKENYIVMYETKGCNRVSIYYIENPKAMVLYDLDASVPIKTITIQEGQDYASPFDQLEKEALNIIKNGRQENGNIKRHINHEPPIPININQSKSWMDFNKENSNKEENNTQQQEIEQDNFVVDEMRTININTPDQLPKRKTTYPNQKSQRETTTIEILFDEKDLNSIRRMLKDMINKKFDINYSITDVIAKTFNKLKVLAMINNCFHFSRLKKVAEFAINDAKDYLQVDLNISSIKPLALYCSTPEPDDNKCLGMIINTKEGKFLAIGPDLDDDSFFVIGDEIKQGKSLEEVLNNTDVIKLFGGFDEAEAWIIQKNGSNILSKQAEDNLRKTPNWKEYIKDYETEEELDSEDKKEDKKEKSEKQNEEPKELKRLRLHYIPTDPIDKYLDEWLNTHREIIKN